MAASPRLEPTNGSSFAAEFGGAEAVSNAVGARNPLTGQAAGNNTGAQSAPAKAPSAPGKSKDVFTGLCEALNTFQRRLADPKDPNRKYDVPDEYLIEFTPTTLGGATLKRQGTTDKSNVPMQAQTPQALKPDSNSVNNNAVTRPVTAGTQIIQFIDQVMRESSYITDQQLYITNPVFDPTTGVQNTIPNPNPPGGIVAWYKVSVEATQLAYDTRRHDHAYRMKFVITPYAINSLPSDWFNNSRYRGSHKSYNYWFTGANKEILNFEQEYNNMYRLVISGLNVPVQQARTDFRDQYRRTFLPTSENHAKGAAGNTNEGGDNAASFLYSPTDQAKARLRIVGDPAWMQQGEISGGVNERDFNFDPFNDDGGINYDSQEVVFDISWNQPQDYNLNTGLMEIKNTEINPGGTPTTQPQLNFTYTAIKCKNIFSKGRFEQELEGRLLIEYEKNPTPTDTGRPTTNNPGTANGTRTSITAEDTNNGWVNQNGLLVQRGDVVPDTNDNQEGAAPQLLNSPPPEPPTSDGDIVSPGDEDAQQVAFNPPPAPATADQLAAAYGGIAPTSDEIAARNAYIAAGSPSTGPLREAYVTAGVAFNNRVADQQAAGVNSQSQLIDRET